jgi:DNA-binding MarR family transcriptional regulator
MSAPAGPAKKRATLNQHDGHPLPGANEEPGRTVGEEGDPDVLAIRGALNRKTLASHRQRSVIARRLGVTGSELAALIVLSQGPMTPGQLANELHLTSGGVTALLHRLDRAGHLRRRPDPGDRRRVFLHASPVTLGAVAELLEPMIADLDAVAARLVPRDRELIARYLNDIADISERHVEQLARGPHEPEPEPDLSFVWA